MPLIHATRAPTQRTALLQVSPAVVPFNLDFHGKVPEAGVVRRNLLHSLAEVSWLSRPTACRSVFFVLTAFFLFGFRSSEQTFQYFRTCIPGFRRSRICLNATVQGPCVQYKACHEQLSTLFLWSSPCWHLKACRHV